MSYTTSELIWLHGLMQDLKVSIPLPMDLFCDNLSSKYIVENKVFQERTKHLKVDCHFIRDYVDSNFTNIHHIQTFVQLVDILTKPLAAPQHKFFADKLGLVCTSPQAWGGILSL